MKVKDVVRVWGQGVCGNSVLCHQFCYEPKTLRNKVFFFFFFFKGYILYGSNYVTFWNWQTAESVNRSAITGDREGGGRGPNRWDARGVLGHGQYSV